MLAPWICRRVQPGVSVGVGARHYKNSSSRVVAAPAPARQADPRAEYLAQSLVHRWPMMMFVAE